MFRCHSLFQICCLLICTACAFSSLPLPALTGETPLPDAFWLEDLDIRKVTQDWGLPAKMKSVEGRPIMIGGIQFTHGIGTHANSEFAVDLKGAAVKFVSAVGLNDESCDEGSVTFEVWVDGRKKADTGLMKAGDPPQVLEVDLHGANDLLLVVTDAGNRIGCDHADWAGAMIVLDPSKQNRPEALPSEDDMQLPLASGTSEAASINGPMVIGTTPGKPFLFKVPATGRQPILYSAYNLPDGLTINSKTGLITGSVNQAGKTRVKLTAVNPRGKVNRHLLIVAGKHKLALTPPMGWNSWNVWGCSVDEQKVRDAIDGMVESGLINHGYAHVNIDDCWMGKRDRNGRLMTNEKFPDMKALADYAHSKGIKLGIYSSPGPKTCANHEGSYQHEQLDVDTWAEWGIDYLKYDWCSYHDIAKNFTKEELIKPYRIMRECLDNCKRDIVYSLCQYGMGDSWEWAAEAGGNLWRTTGDISDSWQSMSVIGFSHHKMSPYAGPGHWNDPDMLVVGKVGWGPSIRKTQLSHNEQVTHISLWSLLAAPLLLGCDLKQMDQFTLDLLTNDEVIAVDQDPLGKAAMRIVKDGYHEIWSRPLWDGTTAVGLFNRGYRTSKIILQLSDLSLRANQSARDLWQKKDIGIIKHSETFEIPAHGCILLKIGKPKVKNLLELNL